jgi:hypothetical protein
MAEAPRRCLETAINQHPSCRLVVSLSRRLVAMTPPTAEDAALRRVRERNGEVRGEKCAKTENGAKAGFRKEKKEQKGGKRLSHRVRITAPPEGLSSPSPSLFASASTPISPTQNMSLLGQALLQAQRLLPPQKMDDGRWTPLPDGNSPPPVLPYLHLRFLLPHLCSR